MGPACGEQKEEQSAEKVAPGIGEAQGARNLAVQQGGERADGVENSRRAEGPNIEQKFGQAQGSPRAPRRSWREKEGLLSSGSGRRGGSAGCV